MRVVVDTSVLLAVFFDEPQSAWAAERLSEHASDLLMSTVNLAETLIRVRDRKGQQYETIESVLLTSGIRFIAPDVEQARIVAEARVKYPLNLGDCFAFALASVRRCPILTLDGDFRSLSWPVVMPTA